MNSLTIFPPAKINIGLNIKSKRADGFHNLVTFFYPIEKLHDKITFKLADNFSFVSDSELLNKEKNNLIVQAHKLLEDFTNKKLNVEITLNKNIPVGAGLGGGSSDAASTLTGLNNLFKLKLNYSQLISLSLQLGSDVPFFIKSQAAVGKSRGEVLEYSGLKINKPLLIVNPGIHISTKEAFEKLIPHENNFDYTYFLKKDTVDFTYLKKNLKNDFEENIFKKHPQIKTIKETMYNCGSLFSLMSGTGSTVYGFFESEQTAINCKNLLPDNYFKKVV